MQTCNKVFATSSPIVLRDASVPCSFIDESSHEDIAFSCTEEKS